MLTSEPVLVSDARAICLEQKSRLADLAGRRLLISGASGFLCSYFIDILRFYNEQTQGPKIRVCAVDNFLTGLPDRLDPVRTAPWMELVKHDVTAPLDFLGEFDFILHGASVASPTFYRKFPLETIDVNVTGTRRMLELARLGAARTVFLSTSEIYGDPDAAHIPTPESYRGFVSSVGPRACYDESKRLAETLCATYRTVHGLEVRIARPFNVYGPGQRIDDRRIVPDLMRAALAKQPIVLHSDGRPTRAFCYAADAVRALLPILVSPSREWIFNLGSDEAEISVAKLAELMGTVAGIEVQYQVSGEADYLTDNPERRLPDLTRIRREFGFVPKVDLRQGLERTLAFYRDVPVSALELAS